MPQLPQSVQEYLDHLTATTIDEHLYLIMSDPTATPSVEPSTPAYPYTELEERPLFIPLSLQLPYEPIEPQPQQPDRPPSNPPLQHPIPHPCGLFHEGPCPAPITSRREYDEVKDAITELDIQVQAQAPPQTGPHSYHHVHPRAQFNGLTREELESDLSRIHSIMRRLIHTIEVEEEQYQQAQENLQRLTARRDQHLRDSQRD
jgi:hypothetical protein